MEYDEILFTILEDGRIKMETPDLAGVNHTSADRLLGDVARLAGGHLERSKVPHAHKHGHTHHKVKQGR